MRVFENIPSIPSVEDQKDNVSEVGWKDALQTALAPSQQAISFQRAWSRLTMHLRDLCPETQWVFLCENSYEATDVESLTAIQEWMESIVANPQWPFPEKIIVTSEGKGESRSWKIMVDKDCDKLPYADITDTITVLPWSDQFCHGWKIKTATFFNERKTGSA